VGPQQARESERTEEDNFEKSEETKGGISDEWNNAPAATTQGNREPDKTINKEEKGREPNR